MHNNNKYEITRATNDGLSHNGIDELSTILVNDIRKLIDSGKSRVAQAVNQELVILYWNIGNRIRQDVLKDIRAEYGKQVISTLANHLTLQYGRGFSDKNLFRMVTFTEAFPTYEIVSTLSRQLSWSHFVELLLVKDPLELQFYTEMCRKEQWSVRTLRSKIDGMLYQRTALYLLINLHRPIGAPALPPI